MLNMFRSTRYNKQLINNILLEYMSNNLYKDFQNEKYHAQLQLSKCKQFIDQYKKQMKQIEQRKESEIRKEQKNKRQSEIKVILKQFFTKVETQLNKYTNSIPKNDIIAKIRSNTQRFLLLETQRPFNKLQVQKNLNSALNDLIDQISNDLQKQENYLKRQSKLLLGISNQKQIPKKDQSIILRSFINMLNLNIGDRFYKENNKQKQQTIFVIKAKENQIYKTQNYNFVIVHSYDQQLKIDSYSYEPVITVCQKIKEGPKSAIQKKNEIIYQIYLKRDINQRQRNSNNSIRNINIKYTLTDQKNNESLIAILFLLFKIYQGKIQELKNISFNEEFERFKKNIAYIIQYLRNREYHIAFQVFKDRVNNTQQKDFFKKYMQIQ